MAENETNIHRYRWVTDLDPQTLSLQPTPLCVPGVVICISATALSHPVNVVAVLRRLSELWPPCESFTDSSMINL